MASDTSTLDQPSTGTDAPATPQEPVRQISASAKASKFPEAFGELEELERPAAKPATPAPAPKIQLVPPAKPAAPADKPAAKPPVEAAKPAPGDKAPAAKPGDAADGAPAPGPGDAPDPTAKFTTAHDLRKEFRKLHKAVQEKEGELAKLRSKPEQAPVNNAVLEENKIIKKRLEEVESELRYVDYTKSAEFKEKFEKPYQDAYDDALEEVKELRVTSPDGSSRQATSQDFAKVLAADSADVKELANNLFGDGAQDVLAARRRLQSLNKTANREASRYREAAVARDRERAIKSAEERDGMERMWNSAITTIKDKYPEYFGHIDGDDEYNKELDAGYDVVDRAHQNGLPMEEKISRLAALRHRAAAFRAQVLMTKRLKARVSELEGVVQEYEKSAPGAGAGASEGSRVPNGQPADSFASAMDELEELGRKDPAD